MLPKKGRRERMLIRIIKELKDIPEFKRPYKGKVFEVSDTRTGKYKPQENYHKIIIVRGQEVSVGPDEYEVVRA